MKVKELIEKLNEMDQDLNVMYTEAKHMQYHTAPIEQVSTIFDNGQDIVIIGDFKEWE